MEAMSACTIFGLGNLFNLEEEKYEDVMEENARDEMKRLSILNDLDKTIVSNEKDTTLDESILEPLVDEETLWLAAEEGDLEGIERCIRCRVNLDAIDANDQYSAMLIAAESGHLGPVAALHEASATIDTRDAFGRTPLYAAAVAGHDRVVAYLAKCADANIEAMDDDDRTPLWASCATRQLEAASVLAEVGASLNEPDKAGLTPYEFASQNGHADVIAFLKKRGVKRPKSRLWTDEVRRSFIMSYDQIKNDIKSVASSSPKKQSTLTKLSSQSTGGSEISVNLVTPNDSESSSNIHQDHSFKTRRSLSRRPSMTSQRPSVNRPPSVSSKINPFRR